MCAGLAARTLGGVEDKDMHAVRGQRVLVRAPWIDKAMGLEESPAKDTYLIPRKNGNVSYPPFSSPATRADGSLLAGCTRSSSAGRATLTTGKRTRVRGKS